MFSILFLKKIGTKILYLTYEKRNKRKTRERHTYIRRNKMFWRTTIRKKHLSMSKHNNQSKFPQGQFISQLHPQCDLVEILLTGRFWEASCHLGELHSPQREEQGYSSSRNQVLKHSLHIYLYLYWVTKKHINYSIISKILITVLKFFFCKNILRILPSVMFTELEVL